ncbi:MAG TPA: LD-carboxypeptidase [Steroidobacteraceae bacterium]|nr:LD-carboxypeptidase [Steroidobacteraceae bacterium]
MQQLPLLAPGDVVDVVAPGFRCTPEQLAGGIAFLERRGLVPRVPADLFGEDLLCANSDARRFAQLRKALFARDSRAIWCVRGGYGAIRIIERLQALTPPRKPKLFIGYSDATTVHQLLNLFWGWPSLHGPLLDRLGTAEIRDEERLELDAVLLGGVPLTTFANLTPLNAAARRRQHVVSRLTGGNLTVLQSTLGTTLQRRPAGILVLEDIAERGYRIDRILEQLRQAGFLRNLKAIVLGTFLGGAEADGGNLGPAVLERFARTLSIPVLAGMDAGHGPYQRPVFLHTRAELQCGPDARLSVHTPSFVKR